LERLIEPGIHQIDRQVAGVDAYMAALEARKQELTAA